MPKIVRASKWKYDSSDSGGFGIGFFTAEGGQVSLTNPSGSKTTFTYGSAGAGLSLGVKIPGVGKLDFGAAVSPAALPGGFGALYILDTFNGVELTRSDITGACMLVEVGGGFGLGYSTTAMVLGMNPEYAAAALTLTMGMPLAAGFADSMMANSATCVLFTGGAGVGVIAGGGITGMLGALY